MNMNNIINFPQQDLQTIPMNTQINEKTENNDNKLNISKIPHPMNKLKT